MNITLLRQPFAEVQAQWLVVGLFEDESEPPVELRGTRLENTIQRLIASKDVTGSLGELMPFYDPAAFATQSLLMVGLGSRSRFDAAAAFSSGYAFSKRLSSKPRETVAVVLPDTSDPVATAQALIEGAIVATRGPGLKKSEANRHAFETLSLVIALENTASDEILLASLQRAQVVGEAVNLARDLVNTPPGEKSPARLCDRIGVIAADAGLAVEIWDEERIRHERFGGLDGVASGSDEPARFMVLDHKGGGDAPTLALVGKGVTFDSGGLCLKPAASMEDMKSDMTGAAVVAAAMQAIARLALPINVVGYLALTENMTGGKAMKMGDVLTMRNGKTVEIMNTDAEGRLILADALSYAVERQPGRILDLATLTGACIVALGLKVAGLFSNDDGFSEDLMEVCRKTGERVWRLPLHDDYKEQLKSSVADIKNVGGKWGGAVTAAKFLEQFVGSTPWIHLDIAGPSWSDTENSMRDAGGTGCFVRTLVAYAERFSQEQRGDQAADE